MNPNHILNWRRLSRARSRQSWLQIEVKGASPAKVGTQWSMSDGTTAGTVGGVIEETVLQTSKLRWQRKAAPNALLAYE
jgi:hypothetical protein